MMKLPTSPLSGYLEKLRPKLSDVINSDAFNKQPAPITTEEKIPDKPVALGKPVSTLTQQDLPNLLEADNEAINIYQNRINQLHKDKDNPDFNVEEYNKLNNLMQFRTSRRSITNEVLQGKRQSADIPSLAKPEFDDEINTINKIRIDQTSQTATAPITITQTPEQALATQQKQSNIEKYRVAEPKDTLTERPPSTIRDIYDYFFTPTEKEGSEVVPKMVSRTRKVTPATGQVGLALAWTPYTFINGGLEAIRLASNKATPSEITTGGISKLLEPFSELSQSFTDNETELHKIGSELQQKYPKGYGELAEKLYTPEALAQYPTAPKIVGGIAENLAYFANYKVLGEALAKGGQESINTISKGSQLAQDLIKRGKTIEAKQIIDSFKKATDYIPTAERLATGNVEGAAGMAGIPKRTKPAMMGLNDIYKETDNLESLLKSRNIPLPPKILNEGNIVSEKVLTDEEYLQKLRDMTTEGMGYTKTKDIFPKGKGQAGIPKKPIQDPMEILKQTTQKINQLGGRVQIRPYSKVTGEFVVSGTAKGGYNVKMAGTPEFLNKGLTEQYLSPAIPTGIPKPVPEMAKVYKIVPAPLKGMEFKAPLKYNIESINEKGGRVIRTGFDSREQAQAFINAQATGVKPALAKPEMAKGVEPLAQKFTGTNFENDLNIALKDLKQFAKKQPNAKEFERAIGKGEFSTNVIFDKVRKSFPEWTFAEQERFANNVSGRMLIKKANAEMGRKSATLFNFEDFYAQATGVKPALITSEAKLKDFVSNKIAEIKRETGGAFDKKAEEMLNNKVKFLSETDNIPYLEKQLNDTTRKQERFASLLKTETNPQFVSDYKKALINSQIEKEAIVERLNQLKLASIMPLQATETPITSGVMPKQGITTPEAKIPQLLGGEIPPKKPPAPPVSPEGAMGEPEKVTGFTNISKEQQGKIKQTVETIKPELEDLKGKTLTHNEVLEDAKKYNVLKGTISREQTLKSEAEAVNLQKQLKAISESDGRGLSAEFLQGLKVYKSHFTDVARQLEAAKMEGMPELMQTKTKILQDILKLDVDANKILDAAKGVDFTNMAQVTDFYRKFVKAPIWDIIKEYRYINTLSSPKTHIINAFSNMLQLAGMRPAVKLVSGGLDMVGSALSGKAREYYIKEVPHYYRGVINSFSDAIHNTWQVVLGKTQIRRPDIAQIPTGAKVLKPFVFIPRALEALDIFGQTLIKGGEKEAMAYRLLKQGKELTASELIKIEKEGQRLADEYLFRDAIDPKNLTGQGHLLSAVDKFTKLAYATRKVPGGSWFALFIQTPMNIFKRGIETTPFGLATLPGHARKTEQLAKMVIGSTVMGGGAVLAMNDRLTWGVPTDPKLREAFYAAGKQPYSIKIGDKWVSFSKLGVLAYPLAIPAAFKWYWDDNPKESTQTKTDKSLAVLTSLAKFFGEQSYVQGMYNLWQTVAGEIGFKVKTLAGLARQAVPLVSLQNWITSIIDDTYRKPDSAFNLKSFYQNIAKGIPFLSETVPPALDLNKQSSKRDMELLNPFLPTTISKEKPEFVDYLKSLTSHKKFMAVEGKRKEELKTKSQEIYDEAKRLYPDDKDNRNEYYKQLKASGSITKEGWEELKDTISEAKLGLNYQEKFIKSMGVENGERAKYIYDEVQKLGTQEEKHAYYGDLLKKKLITKEVGKQYRKLKEKK